MRIREERFVAAVCALALAGCAAGCGSKTSTLISYSPDASTISRIYISFWDMGLIDSAYKIDLVQKELDDYHFQEGGTSFGFSVTTPHDDSFAFVRDLSDDSISKFIGAPNRYGFLRWSENYDNSGVYDGIYSYITVIFADGTQRKVISHYAYPATWNRMNDALRALTGEEILGKAQ